jgi:hypothetical protein
MELLKIRNAGRNRKLTLVLRVFPARIVFEEGIKLVNRGIILCFLICLSTVSQLQALNTVKSKMTE